MSTAVLNTNDPETNDPTTQRPATKRTVVAVGALFFVNGALFSNWVPRIAEVRDHLGVTNGVLGGALLGGGLGGLVASFVAGKVLDRVGTRNGVTAAASLVAVFLPLIGLAPKAWALLAALFLIGLFDVFNDLAMNAQGVMAQGRLERPIMNRLHAMWSVGFVVGAVVGSAASAAKISIPVHLTAVGVVMLATVWAARRWLIVTDPPLEAKVSKPTGQRSRVSTVVVLMATSAVGAALFEASANDWSTIVLKDILHARYTGLGTVAFAGSMLTGRLFGDHIIERFGQHRTLTVAVFTALVGAAVVVASSWLPLTLVGFGVWGFGVSVLFPQLYERAAHLPNTSASTGLAAMAVGQRSGFLVAPVVIGAVADATNLRIALGGVIAVAGLLFFAERIAP
jgi:MFS family permease